MEPTTTSTSVSSRRQGLRQSDRRCVDARTRIIQDEMSSLAPQFPVRRASNAGNTKRQRCTSLLLLRRGCSPLGIMASPPAGVLPRKDALPGLGQDVILYCTTTSSSRTRAMRPFSFLFFYLHMCLGRIFCRRRRTEGRWKERKQSQGRKGPGNMMPCHAAIIIRRWGRSLLAAKQKRGLLDDFTCESWIVDASFLLGLVGGQGLVLAL